MVEHWPTKRGQLLEGAGAGVAPIGGGGGGLNVSCGSSTTMLLLARGWTGMTQAQGSEVAAASDAEIKWRAAIFAIKGSRKCQTVKILIVKKHICICCGRYGISADSESAGRSRMNMGFDGSGHFGASLNFLGE